MIKSHRLSIAAIAIVFLLALAPSNSLFAQDNAKPAYTVQDLNEQMVMALAWVQTSAEYRELCYQAFNLAGMLVDKAVASAQSGEKPLAVIADLDESLIDNSAYDARTRGAQRRLFREDVDGVGAGGPGEGHTGSRRVPDRGRQAGRRDILRH